MLVPGSNLLKLALTVIGSQLVQYQSFVSKETNAAGIKVPTYAAVVPLKGSFQPVARQYYNQMGLDFNKEYCNWYDPNATVNDLGRDRKGDRIIFAGKVFEALSSSDWKAVDGWNGTIFVRIPDGQ